MDKAGEPTAKADGVAVISVWTRGAGGGMLARLTLSAADGGEDVRVVTSSEDIRGVLDEWLGSLVR